MLNPVAMNAVAQARRNDILKQAEARRRANQVKSSRPRLSETILKGLTGLLANTSEQLKDSQTQTESKVTA